MCLPHDSEPKKAADVCNIKLRLTYLTLTLSLSAGLHPLTLLRSSAAKMWICRTSRLSRAGEVSQSKFCALEIMTTSTWCFVWSFPRASTKADEVSLIFAVHLSTAGWRKMERCQMSKVPAFLLQLYDPRKHWKTSTDTTAKWHDTMMVCTQTMVTVYHIIICKGFCATREFAQKESRQLLTFQHLSCASHHVQHLPLKTHANPEHGYQFTHRVLGLLAAGNLY